MASSCWRGIGVLSDRVEAPRNGRELHEVGAQLKQLP